MQSRKALHNRIIFQQYQDDYADDMRFIKAVYEHDTLLLVKQFKSFSEPIWVDGLKEEFEVFKQNCIQICKDINVDPRLSQEFSKDGKYQIDWNEGWVFLMIYGPFIRTPRPQVEKYLISKGIKIEKRF